MRVSEDGIPSKALQATPVCALIAVLSHWPGVPELGRSVSLTCAVDFESSRAENRPRRSESDRMLMPTFDVTDWSAFSASQVAGSGIRTGRIGASGCRISSPPRIVTDLISERTR